MEKVTEIERAAITNLYSFKNLIIDHRLAEYVEKIGTDANYKYIANELHPNNRINIYDEESDNTTRRRRKAAGRAIFNLATDIVIYRNNGRPEGDQTTEIDHMSGITVTSSLAASVAEFTQNILNAYLID